MSRFALVVFAAGVVGLLSGLGSFDPAIVTDPIFWAFAGFAVAGEFLPVTVHRRGMPEQLMASASFTFALLIYAGAVPAMVVLATASTLADLRAGRAWDRILFNAGQYMLSFAAAGAVLGLLGHPFGTLAGADLTVAQLWPLVPAGLTIFLVNHMLVGLAVALAQRSRLGPIVLEDLPFQLLTSGVLLALGPVVVVVAARSLLLLPCLLVPVLALHHSTKQSVEDAERAHHDPLTGLPNRDRFTEYVHWALEKAKPGSYGAVLMLDLDRFGEVNDTLGHRAGGDLLRLVADRLRDGVGSGGIVARLGGDEFGVLAPGLQDEPEAVRLADRLLADLSVPYRIEQFSLHVRPSIGLALYPRDGADSETLLRRSDVAMHLAKRHGNGVEAYAADADRHSHRRLQLANDLVTALTDGQVQVHYQPKADVGTNEIVGVEALARWTHPTLGHVPPDEFIPLAERAGLIDRLTEHVLDSALAHCALWQRAGFNLHVAVNLSMKTVHDTVLPAVVERALQRHGVAPGQLHLEVTESVIMLDHERATATLGALRDLGVQLAVDDFGTGYSSLAHLKHLPVGQLKIDKAFVRNMDDDEADAAIVRSAIELGHRLGLRVVAEGVESPAVWDALHELGCDELQGYFLSQPLPAEELMIWLLQRLTGMGEAKAVSAMIGTRPQVAEPALPTVVPLRRRAT